jgi:hypothetical protein
MRKSLTALGAILALTGVPAQAACWSPQAAAAAKVRDLDTMLMVSALRCRFGGAGLLDRYNQVIVRHRAALTHHNGNLRAHFVAMHGPREGANALDRYVTRVANRYGAGAEGLSCESLKSIADAALASASTPQALAELAEVARVVPEMAGGECRAQARVAIAGRRI